MDEFNVTMRGKVVFNPNTHSRQNMNLNNQEVVLDILNIAIDAGKEILKIYKKNFNVDLKADNSPITEADINSNNLIKKKLIEIDNQHVQHQSLPML